jgi:hypothetical protein|mmetsp:Transcript_17015/g.2814  ORF Transcript_17015/g.2814 Transcript_17015/m.2814 type:complete len:98 (+) Transcript_17015:1008-1301(+)
MGSALFFLSSFHYSGALVFCNIKYGLKLSSSIYGYILLATTPTTINLGLIKSMEELIGYSGIYYILSGIMVAGLVLNTQLSEEPYKCTKKSSISSLI